MNRLAPLIDRRIRALPAAPLATARNVHNAPPTRLSDAKLFLGSYLAGVVIFGTFLA